MKEREVKLSAGEDFELPELGGVHGVVLKPRTEQVLSTVYLDSDDFRLARWGLSFRHRAGQGWTVKLPSDGDGPLLVRDEIVFKSHAGTPPSAAADLVKGYLRTEGLRPQVRLRTLRRGVLLHDAQARLLADVVDDAVSIVDGPLGGSAFRELEVETTEDTPEGLLDSILKRLRRAGAGPPDPTPKYLRAIGGTEAAPPEIERRALSKRAPAGEVIAHAIADGVWRLLRHDPIVRLDTDPEGVHQAWVVTLRMRSDLRTFRALLDPDWVAALRAELGWLGSEFGQARDAVVLLERLRHRAQSLTSASAGGAGEVLACLEQRRAEVHATLLTTLSGERYLNVVERLIGAAQAPALLDRKAGRPAAKVLAPIVRRAWRPLAKRVSGLADQPSDEDLHEIRSLAERCRYAAEACAPSLGKRTHNLARAAANVQDVLGELGDAVLADRWLRDFAAESSPTAAFAAGELAALERAAADTARSSWTTAWARLAKQAPPPA